MGQMRLWRVEATTPLTLALPERLSTMSEGAELFEEVAQAVRAEWKVRKIEVQANYLKALKRPLAEGEATPVKPSFREANAWLRMTCYELLSHYVDLGMIEVFQSAIKQGKRRRMGRRGEPNSFQDGLLAIFPMGHEDWLGPTERERYGKRMMYAYRHHVPPVFLEPFLRMHGEAAEAGISDEAVIDPVYTEWIAHCLRTDPHIERGPYPDGVADEIARFGVPSQDDLRRQNADLMTELHTYKAMLLGFIEGGPRPTRAYRSGNNDEHTDSDNPVDEQGNIGLIIGGQGDTREAEPEPSWRSQIVALIDRLSSSCGFNEGVIISEYDLSERLDDVDVATIVEALRYTADCMQDFSGQGRV